MSKPNYRVILTYDAERKIFHARAPELEHCSGEGASRAEAISRVEEEIDAQLANMLSHGTAPPRSVDEETYSGELAVKVSKGLHRDLAYQARSEGIELDHLVGELLAAAMEGRKQTHRGVRSGNRQGQEHVPHDNIGNRHDGGAGPRRGGFGRGNNNYQLLDDRANFIEYVRGLEQSGGHGHGRPQGQGGPGGGDRRRRGRGGRGGGPDRGNFRQGGYQGQGGPQHGGPQGHHGHGGQGQGQPGQGHGMNGNGAPARNGGAPLSASAPAPSAPPAGPDSHGGSDDGEGNV
jgi:predicted RNase H-like HicB family nuclease